VENVSLLGRGMSVLEIKEEGEEPEITGNSFNGGRRTSYLLVRGSCFPATFNRSESTLVSRLKKAQSPLKSQVEETAKPLHT